MKKWLKNNWLLPVSIACFLTGSIGEAYFKSKQPTLKVRVGDTVYTIPVIKKEVKP